MKIWIPELHIQENVEGNCNLVLLTLRMRATGYAIVQETRR